MQVSNQSSANALLASTKNAMDPQQLRARKLFAQKQAQLGINPSKSPSVSSTAAADRMAKAQTAISTHAPASVKDAMMKAAGLKLGNGGPSGGDAGIAPLPSELASELSVEGLMARWGQADTAYDLDKSGSVDMKDLVMLLSDQGQAAGATPPKLGETVPSLGTTDPMADPAGDVPPLPELSVDGLMKAWGTDNATYDLDGDGTVGMNDLLAMLAETGVASPLGTGNGSGGAAEPQPADLTVDGFAAAWGTDDAMYDLDGDGTVGMNDLLAHLATVAPDAADEGVPPTESFPGSTSWFAPNDVPAELGDTAPVTGKDAKIAAEAPMPKPEIKDPAMTLAETLDKIDAKTGPGIDPGTSVSPTATGTGDLSVEGTSNLDPALLGGPTSYWGMADAMAGDATLDLATLAGLSDSGVQAGTIETPQQAADILAKQLHERLGQFGFTESPPSNLHDILDGLHMSDGDRKMVLDRMQDMYPDGLGLNLVG